MTEREQALKIACANGAGRSGLRRLQKKLSAEENKLRLMRAAKTNAEHRFGMGGRLKNTSRRPTPRKPTLPKLKCLETED